MGDEQNLEVMHRLAELWNAGDDDALLALFHEDCLTLTTPEWPVQGPWRGREAFRSGLLEWRAPWGLIGLQLMDAEQIGDSVAAHGRWHARGESSGAAGEMDFGVLLRIEHGLITRLEFFREPEHARQAARA